MKELPSCATDHDVNPNDSLLKQISTTDLPGIISIDLQNWNKCVFKAEFPRVSNIVAENPVFDSQDMRIRS